MDERAARVAYQTLKGRAERWKRASHKPSYEPENTPNPIPSRRRVRGELQTEGDKVG